MTHKFEGNWVLARLYCRIKKAWFIQIVEFNEYEIDEDTPAEAICRAALAVKEK